jgi:hypothetical protein
MISTKRAILWQFSQAVWSKLPGLNKGVTRMMQSSNGGSGSFLCLSSCHYYLVVAFTPFTKLDCFPLSLVVHQRKKSNLSLLLVVCLYFWPDFSSFTQLE